MTDPQDPNGGKAQDNNQGGDGSSQEPDIEATVLKMLKKHDSPNDAVATLLKDNFSFREKNRTLQQQLTDLQKQLEKQDDPTESLALLAQYQTLGSVDDIKGLKTNLSEMERDTTLRRVADAHNLNYDVLKTLDKTEDSLLISFKEVDGRPIASVTVDDQEIPFDDFVKTRWSSFEPSLRQGGVKFPEQHSGSKKPARGGLVDAFIQGKKDQRSKDS